MIEQKELKALLTRGSTLTNDFLQLIAKYRDEESREEIKFYIEEFERLYFQLVDSFDNPDAIQTTIYL